VYHILYEEVDESAVEILTIQSPCGEADSSVDEYRYPRAGKKTDLNHRPYP
jgi:hypothetical protein